MVIHMRERGRGRDMTSRLACRVSTRLPLLSQGPRAGALILLCSILSTFNFQDSRSPCSRLGIMLY